MKRGIIIFLLLASVLSFAQRRYYHETANSILRVDENYPGAFVEHRFIPTGADNLFRAFLVFGDESGAFAYGSAHEYPPLSAGTFVKRALIAPSTPDTFQIYEFYDTLMVLDSHYVDSHWVHDTSYTANLASSRTVFTYEDTLFGIRVEQSVTASFDTVPAFFVRFIFTNTRPTAISGLKTAFFYDGDVPDWGYRDDYPFSVSYLDAVAVRDGSVDNGVCSGFCALYPNGGPSRGAWFEWVDTTNSSDTASIIALLNDPPFWPTSAITPGDWSVYAIWDFSDLPAGAVDSLRIAFIARDSTGFDSLAASARGDTVHASIEEFVEIRPEHIQILIAPNPFNSACEITFPRMPHAETSLEIFSMDGRTVRTFELSGMAEKTLWDARDESGNNLPSGIYFVRLNSKGETLSTAKAILIK